LASIPGVVSEELEEVASRQEFEAYHYVGYYAPAGGSTAAR
jgi:hypothetical protein